MRMYIFEDSNVEYTESEAEFYKSVTGYSYRVVVV